MVPAHLRDSHYRAAGGLGHGSEYVYPHDQPHHTIRQEYFPDEVEPVALYRPSGEGREAGLAERLEWLDRVFGRER